MEQLKFIYSSYGNRELPEEKQGYALVTLISAASKSALTNHLVNESIKAGKKDIKIDYAQKSLEINKKHCPKVFNVTDPLTGEVFNELVIDQLFEYGQFAELYEEISNVIGDVSLLKEGVKKKQRPTLGGYPTLDVNYLIVKPVPFNVKEIVITNFQKQTSNLNC